MTSPSLQRAIFCTFLFCNCFFNILLSYELKQSNFLLHFTCGAFYNILETCESKTNILIEWNIVEDTNNERFGLQIKPRAMPLAFISSHNQKLVTTLFSSEQFDDPLAFAGSNNSSRTIIWKNKNSGSKHVAFPIWIALPPQQFVMPGEYKCYLDVSLVSNDMTLINESTLELIVIVQPSHKIEILIGGAKRGAGQKELRLDFAEITEITTRTFQIEVVSNIACEIQCKSINGGKLIMKPEWRRMNYACIDILYGMTFQGKKIDLTNGYSILLHHPPQRSNRGILYPLSIAIQPDLQRNWEGIYEDEILFSIRPTI